MSPMLGDDEHARNALASKVPDQQQHEQPQEGEVRDRVQDVAVPAPAALFTSRAQDVLQSRTNKVLVSSSERDEELPVCLSVYL